MPDFDKFERLLRQALVGDCLEARHEVASRIAVLPEEERPAIVKRRPRDEIERWLGRAAAALEAEVGPDAGLTTSDANLVGKDLYSERTGQHIELKSGPLMTDGNSGLGTIAWALGDDDCNELKRIMAGSMKERRDLFMSSVSEGNGRPDPAIEQSKQRTMDRVHSYMLERVQPGSFATDRLAHYVTYVSIGITKGSQIKSLFGEQTRDLPLLLQADWTHGLMLYAKAFDPRERIRVAAVRRTATRAQMTLSGTASGRTAMIYPNYKNSFEHESGVRIPAEHWVATACFHVWVD